MTYRLRRAARRERARRYVVMYATSALLFVVLSAPLWLIVLLATRR